MEGISIRVLLIVDNTEDADQIAAIIRSASSVPVSIERAALSHNGLALNGDQTFDLVLLDLTCAGFEGLSTFQEVQSISGDAPVVVLTADPQQRMGQAAVREGAQDYVAKSDLRTPSLNTLIGYIAERAQRQQAERELSDRLRQLHLAEAVQQRLYPSAAPRLRGFDIAGSVYPANHVCGDYFDYYDAGCGRAGVVLGDVAGHGLAAALAMIETRSYLRVLADLVLDPGELLTEINRLLIESDLSRFVTLFACTLDEQSRTLLYASAGHRGYVLTSAGRTDMLEATGFPLGCIPQTNIPIAPERVLKPGDLVVVTTDGITETLSPDEQLFGTARMLDVVQNNAGRPAQEIVQELYRAARDFSQNEPQRDDIAVVAIKVH